MEATLQEILEAREIRVQRQHALLQQYNKPIICFTMNIPGPVKLDRDVVIGFFVGCRLLRDALPRQQVLFSQEYREHTGCEAFFVVDMPAKELKQLTTELEDSSMVGRLFDMDVLDIDGSKLSREELGYPPRKCLLCDEDAVVCGSRRVHSVAQLRERTDFLLYLAARQYMAEYIASRAYLALMQEVSTTPQPGLVATANRGSHPDMDIRHFLASATALRPFFCKAAEEGYLTRDLASWEVFPRLRAIGMDAEKAMFAATGGVNTHKGSIFTLSLLCAAAGRIGPDWKSEKLLAEVAAFTRDILNDFSGITVENAKTVGQQLYAQHGITGIRGQAQAGYPAIQTTGLPILRKALAAGYPLNHAGAVTLLHLLTVTEDTNLIHRSNPETLTKTQDRLTDMLKKDPFPDKETIEALDRDFIEKNLSPGGSADLLAATYFLFFLGG